MDLPEAADSNHDGTASPHLEVFSSVDPTQNTFMPEVEEENELT